MAATVRIDDGVGSLAMPKRVIAGDQMVRDLNDSIATIVRYINGRVSFGSGDHATRSGNLDGQFIKSFLTPSVADTEFTVIHGLGRQPVFAFWMLDKAGTIYYSQYAGWNSTSVYLKCTASSATAHLLLV